MTDSNDMPLHELLVYARNHPLRDSMIVGRTGRDMVCLRIRLDELDQLIELMAKLYKEPA